MDLSNDLVNQRYEDVSDAVRQFSAVRMASLAETLKPFADSAFDMDPAALSYMEPARITAQASVIKLYLSALEKLGGLYRVTHVPVVPVPEVEVIRADEVPALIEAAVSEAVTAALKAREDQAALEASVRAQVSSDEAKARLSSALVRIKGRSRGA